MTEKLAVVKGWFEALSEKTGVKPWWLWPVGIVVLVVLFV